MIKFISSPTIVIFIIWMEYALQLTTSAVKDVRVDLLDCLIKIRHCRVNLKYLIKYNLLSNISITQPHAHIHTYLYVYVYL